MATLYPTNCTRDNTLYSKLYIGKAQATISGLTPEKNENIKRTRKRSGVYSRHAGIAQLVEQLIRNE
jgi:hypothetical protein